MPPAERSPTIGPSETLDPSNWDDVRAQAHRMLDEAIDAIANIREQPVWRPIPDEVRARFRAEIPREPSDLGEIYREYSDFIAPYATGNVHPGFMGWVHGGGTVVGMLAEMLAAGLNANLGGRDHMPIEVERQITEWTRTMFGFPEGASGVFVTGTSMANLMAVWVARTAALGPSARASGVGGEGALLTAYTSKAAHGCVSRAMDLAGFGTDALRNLPVDRSHRVDVGAMRAQIKRDREIGLQPFLVVGSAGTVDIGAVDDLAALSALCREEKLWFHVDGAYGALGVLSPRWRRASPDWRMPIPSRSISTNGDRCRTTRAFFWFAITNVISMPLQLRRPICGAKPEVSPQARRGLATSDRICREDFRALKTWFTLKAFGTEKLGAMIERTCQLAHYLEMKVLSEPRLELMAPAQLNIVCFRYRADRADRVNGEIVADIHEFGIAAPSTTTLDGKLAIRAAIVNHRTDTSDLDALVAAVLEFGVRRSSDNCAA